jgi:putative FmdB family regulatory protein
MPIYEYECQKCKSHIEVFQKINDKPPAKCGKCGGRLEKQISAPAIQFKGSGWYVTDYASQSKKADKIAGEGQAEDKTAEKKPDKKTKDEAPATKSSSKASPTKASGKE